MLFNQKSYGSVYHAINNDPYSKNTTNNTNYFDK